MSNLISTQNPLKGRKSPRTSFSSFPAPVSSAVGLNVEDGVYKWFEYRYPSSSPPSVNTTSSNLDNIILCRGNIMVLSVHSKFYRNSIATAVECVYTQV